MTISEKVNVLAKEILAIEERCSIYSDSNHVACLYYHDYEPKKKELKRLMDILEDE